MERLPEDRGSYRITLRCPDGPAISFSYNALVYGTPRRIVRLEEVTREPFERQTYGTDFVGLIGRLRKDRGTSTFRIDLNQYLSTVRFSWFHVDRAIELYAPDSITKRSFMDQARSGALIEINIVDPLPLTPEEEDPGV